MVYFAHDHLGCRHELVSQLSVGYNYTTYHIAILATATRSSRTVEDKRMLGVYR